MDEVTVLTGPFFLFLSQTKESQSPFTNGLSPAPGGYAYSNGKLTREVPPGLLPGTSTGWVRHSALANGHGVRANHSVAHGTPGRTTPPPDYTPPGSPVTYHNSWALPRVQM